MQMNQKNFPWFQKKWQMVPFSFCCNYPTVGYIGMKVSNFVALSVTIAPKNVLTPHIRKTHLSVASLNIRIELMFKRSVKEKRKKGAFPPITPPPRVGLEAQLPPQSLKIYQTEFPLVIKACVSRMWFNLNKVFASDAWVEGA